MKKKFLLAVTCFCVCAAAMAEVKDNNVTETNGAVIVKVLPVKDDCMQLSGVAYDKFATGIGTDEEHLDGYIQGMVQDAVEKNLKGARPASGYTVGLEHYRISAAGYPYNNYRHLIDYAVYDGNKKKIYEGHHQFISFSEVSKNELMKQFGKISKKIVSVIK